MSKQVFQIRKSGVFMFKENNGFANKYSLVVCNLFLSLIFLIPLSVLATSVEYVEVKKVPFYEVSEMQQEWYAIAYQADNENWDSELPAKLCFNAYLGKTKQECFEAKDYVDENLIYFQLVRELSKIPILKNKYPHMGILFVSENIPHGSTSFRLITIWIYDNKSKMFINILPTICISEQGEYKMLKSKQNDENILVVADYRAERETHFAPHKYKISIYQFNSEKMTFKNIGEYTTKKKYKSLDDVDKINIINPETKNIQKFINR
jgi:hypothetical protein